MSIKKYYLHIKVLILCIISLKCVHNYEPIIIELIAEPNPVETGGMVMLKCTANDEDESNIKNKDAISYNWKSDFGSFIKVDTSDTILNSLSDIYWVAPDDTGYYSITCSVEDEYNGFDISSIIVTVQ